MIEKVYGYVFATLISCFFVACDTPEYTAAKNFKDQCWSLEDSMLYSFHVETEKENSFSFQTFMDFEDNFGYRNIYLKAVLKGPEGIEADWLLSDTLVDDLGYWIHDPMATPIAGSQNIAPKRVGLYELRLVQYLRDSNLCNIKAVHIRKLP